MKAIKIISSLLLATACLITVSCDDLLDIPQHGVDTVDNFYNTDDHATQAITAVYADFASISFNYVFLKNTLGDDYWSGGGGRGDNNQLEQMNEYTFDASHSYLSGIFQSYYSVIYRCNVVLDKVPADGSEVMQRARAEAKVFRAYAYIDLISMWGTPPLVDHELEPSEYKQGNGDQAALWALVEKDLTEAINSGVMHEKSSATDDSSYEITKQFAEALLGKAYVFEKKWDDACTVLDKMIAEGKYALYQGKYEDLLMYTAENNCESLFEINRLNDPNNAFTNWTLLTAMIGWRGDRMNIPTSTGIYASCWGFLNPQKGLYDAFVSDEGADGYRLNATMKSYDKLKALGISIMDGKEMYGHEGYFMWKDRVLTGEFISGGWMSSHNNIRYMRYAEALLLAAEAHVMNGTSDKALTYVNQIRTRAKLSPLTSVTMDNVMLEKRLELCGEATRYQDMQRWGIAASLLKDQGKKTPWFSSTGTVRWVEYNSGNGGYKTGKHELLPFPETEIQLNPNIKQNTGW
jgi:SusD family.